MESTATAPAVSAGFDNTYAQLDKKFYQIIEPSQVPQPKLIRFNHALAEELGVQLPHLSAEELAGYFSGNTLFEDGEPLAMAYAGHQFGSLVSQLGDGRALLLGQIVNGDGKR